MISYLSPGEFEIKNKEKEEKQDLFEENETIKDSVWASWNIEGNDKKLIAWHERFNYSLKAYVEFYSASNYRLLLNYGQIRLLVFLFKKYNCEIGIENENLKEVMHRITTSLSGNFEVPENFVISWFAFLRSCLTPSSFSSFSLSTREKDMYYAALLLCCKVLNESVLCELLKLSQEQFKIKFSQKQKMNALNEVCKQKQGYKCLLVLLESWKDLKQIDSCCFKFAAKSGTLKNWKILETRFKLSSQTIRTSYLAAFQDLQIPMLDYLSLYYPADFFLSNKTRRRTLDKLSECRNGTVWNKFLEDYLRPTPEEEIRCLQEHLNDCTLFSASSYFVCLFKFRNTEHSLPLLTRLAKYCFLSAVANNELRKMKRIWFEWNLNVKSFFNSWAIEDSEFYGSWEYAFMRICDTGYFEVVQFLIDQNFLQSAPTFPEGLKAACASGHIKTVKLLLGLNFKLTKSQRQDIFKVTKFPSLQKKIQKRFTKMERLEMEKKQTLLAALLVFVFVLFYFKQ